MFNISGCKPEFGENGHKWKDNIYRAYMGPYYREINPVGPVYLYLGIRNRCVEALSGVFDSHLLSNGVHSLSLVHDWTIHWVGSNPEVFVMYVVKNFRLFVFLVTLEPAFQTKYLEMVWVVSRRAYWIPRLGVAVTLAYALESHEVRLLDLWGKVTR